jgi:four helix bundle protein
MAKPRRSRIQRFEDLPVWQAARELVKGVYHAARTQALRQDRGLVDQMTRAAVSITSNIAEGHERGSHAQYVEFCFYAKGSAGELRSQIVNAHDVGLLSDQAFEWLHGKAEEVSRQLAGYVKHLLETGGALPGMKYTRDADRRRVDWEELVSEFGLQRLSDGRYEMVGSRSTDLRGSLPDAR